MLQTHLKHVISRLRNGLFRSLHKEAVTFRFPTMSLMLFMIHDGSLLLMSSNSLDASGRMHFAAVNLENEVHPEILRPDRLPESSPAS